MVGDDLSEVRVPTEDRRKQGDHKLKTCPLNRGSPRKLGKPYEQGQDSQPPHPIPLPEGEGAISHIKIISSQPYPPPTSHHH